MFSAPSGTASLESATPPMIAPMEPTPAIGPLKSGARSRSYVLLMSDQYCSISRTTYASRTRNSTAVATSEPAPIAT